MARREHTFEYGPVARGSFIALVALGPLVPLYFPGYLFYYFGLLLFLALGLRPLLEVTGLWRLGNWLQSKLPRRWNDKALARHRAQVEAKERQKRLRYSRYRGE